MEKTIKEWLSELPSPYREQALENIKHIGSDIVCKSLLEALAVAFSWMDSEQGYAYWDEIYDKILLGYPLSPVPTPDEKLKEAVELLKEAKKYLRNSPGNNTISGNIESFLLKV